MGTLWQDIRYGFRMLARNPSFAAVVILVLAIGIAANTAIFSVVNAVMLRPLPYRDSDRLVTIQKDGFPRGKKAFDYRPNFFYLQEHNTVFESLAGSWWRASYITGIERPHEAQAFTVTSNLFPLLGVQPTLGRGFVREDENPGSQPVAVLSHAFWKEHFGGDPQVVGTSMSLTVSQRKADYNLVRTQGSPTIVGVMPPGFTFPYGRSVPFWTPVIRIENPDEMPPIIRAIDKLKKGVTQEQANAELTMLLNRVNPGDSDVLAEGGMIYIQGLLDGLLEGHRKLPLLLLGAAGFVVLIACSNAANLFLARATVRQCEMAMRLALGASRRRAIRQMLTESLLLSMGAGILGLVLTFATVKTLVGLCPADIPRLQDTHVDLTVLGFTLGVSVLTGLLFGMMPAWRASDVSISTTLKEGASPISTGRRWRHLHSGLVVSQLGLSLILLVGATLLIRSLISLTSVEQGFQPNNVLALHIELPETKYTEESQNDNFFQSLLEWLRALPGVDFFNGVGIDYTLGATELFEDPFCVEEEGDSVSTHNASFMMVTPDFFTTMGIPFRRGQTLTDQGPDNVVIDETFARECFGDADPIGKIIRFRRPDGQPVQVIGVVDTVRSFGTLEPGRGVVYGRGRRFGNRFAVVLVRTTGDPMSLLPVIRQQVAELEKDQVVETVESLGTTLSRMLAPERFVMILLSVFAAIAVALTRVLSSLLYDVTPTDPLTLACVAIILGGIALLATYIPARRAAKVDPMEALRYE